MLNLFITGCYRSGTTLVEKLLHHHPQICLASQPFPLLYFYLKEAFYASKGIRRRYPLDHLFLEDAYQSEQFHWFLDQHDLTRADLEKLFDQLAEYKLGLWTPEILQFRDTISEGNFISVYRQLNDCVSRLFPKEEPIRYLGGKEVLCEEYVPYLISRDVRAIIVVRDPRDMISSLNFRQRDNLTGENRPVLYSLRAWRKSIATALAHEDHANFLWLRYEDLVIDPHAVLRRITTWLELDDFPEDAFEEGIVDQRSEKWKGNSSFDDRTFVTVRSVGRFAEVMPPSVMSYVEACCYPELKALAYEFYQMNSFDGDVIRNYREPFDRIHDKFSADYSYCEEHVAEENKRYDLLTQSGETVAAEPCRKWFLYPSAYEKLRRALKNGEGR